MAKLIILLAWAAAFCVQGSQGCDSGPYSFDECLAKLGGDKTTVINGEYFSTWDECNAHRCKVDPSCSGCTKRLKCDAGSYFTATEKYVDNKCTTCDDDEYKEGSNAETVCKSKTLKCDAGSYFTATDKTVDNKCTTCGDNKYKEGSNAETVCKSKTLKCDAGWYFTATNKTVDNKCTTSTAEPATTTEPTSTTALRDEHKDTKGGAEHSPAVTTCAVCYSRYQAGKAVDWCRPTLPTLGTSTHGFCETESTRITCDHLKGGWDDCATKWKDWEPETATTTPAGMTAAEERAVLVGILKLAQDQAQKAYAACTAPNINSTNTVPDCAAEKKSLDQANAALAAAESSSAALCSSAIAVLSVLVLGAVW